MTASEAAKLIKSDDKIYIQGSTSIPETLIDAIVDRADELNNVEMISAFAVGARVAPYSTPQYFDSFRVTSFFVANNIRDAIKCGDAQTIPCFLGEVPSLFREGIVNLDVCLLNVSSPDSEGYCSYGISADLAVSAAECAKIVIAQVNRFIPHTYGDALIHISKITAMVESDLPPVELPIAIPNEGEKAIGRYVAEMIPDGATLQIGVGGIPNAVLDALHDHKHLGLHTEALTDGVVPLINSGVIDNSQKGIHSGKTVACLALGSRRLYDYMDCNDDLIMKDVTYTNDPSIIRQNRRMMAVNSALEVDLTGQVCADSIGTQIFSGVGGQHDFMYGASLSDGGRGFIVLPSITNKGISKIKATLTQGAGIVTSRFQPITVVTEWGVEELRGRDLAQRARALSDIAHPSVREEMEREAHLRFGRRFR